MNDTTVGAVLADPAQAGAYYVDARDREALAEAATALGFAVRQIDLTGCAGRDEALPTIAAALDFPDWFGGNLDALADSLSDLSWLPAEGYALLLERTEDWRANEPGTFEAVVSILDEAAARWARDRVPFWGLLPVSTRDLADING